MLVGYFGRSLGLRGGIGRYARELLAGMERAAPANQYLLYTNRQPDTELGANTILRAGPRRLGRVGYEQFWLPAQLMRDMPDVYHSPDYTLPLAARGSFVITVHDLIYLRHPEGTSLRARVLYRVLTRASIARARKVITVSDYTAREIAEYFRVPREKLRVIPHGVNPHLQRLAESADSPAALARLGVRKPFVLFVGLLTPRKGRPGCLRREYFEKSRRDGGGCRRAKLWRQPRDPRLSARGPVQGFVQICIGPAAVPKAPPCSSCSHPFSSLPDPPILIFLYEKCIEGGSLLMKCRRRISHAAPCSFHMPMIGDTR